MSEPVLRVSGLCKRFGALAASREIEFDLWAGEVHALIGPNGAGKSTLIKQIAGELVPDSGTIHFLGRPVTSLSAEKRALLGLARTFQISSLAQELTTLQNVTLAALGRDGGVMRFLRPVANDRALTEKATECVQQAGLAGHEKTRVSELSHGQRRQLEIAMALALEPKAFLLDEPMAGLGGEGSAALIDMLRVLKAKAPILLIEHDMDAVFALADRISVLVYGQIIATGNASEIRANPAVRTAYLGEEA